MKIIIENFGIIKKFKFDLNKDFSLLFGKNSSGKSYAISVVYLIIKSWLELGKNESENVKWGGFVKFNEKKRFVDYFQQEFEQYLNQSFNNSFENINKLQNRFSTQNLKISIIFEKFRFFIGLKNNEQLKIFKTEIYDNAYEYHYLWLSYIANFSNNRIYFLPASRSGLYQALNAFSQIFVQLSQSRNFITKKIEIPSISEPVSDYFLELSNINRKNLNNNISKIAKDMEKEILNGEVIFNDETKKLSFIPNNTDLNLDLSFSSSMVSEIAPIVAYLKYILDNMGENNKPILIIEEPESHLHPEIQIKLMKYFAELSKNGVKIIMTTHSNYMFNKFNNMIFAKELDRQKVQSIFFQVKKEGSQANILEIDEFGIDDENFVEASEKLYNEKMELIDKFNNNEL